MDKLTILLCSFALVGCGALFKGTTQTVNINATPANSAVIVNGQTYTSPAIIQLPRNKDYLVSVSKEGYVTQQFQIERQVSSGIVILDILGGLFPVVIDAAMGTWYNLVPSLVNINLVSEQTGLNDIPVEITLLDNDSLKVDSAQEVQIQIETD